MRVDTERKGRMMFGRRRRNARTTLAIEVQAESPHVLIDGAGSAPEITTTVGGATGPAHHDVELDAVFMAMMAQLDDSLVTMARAWDRIEEAVIDASRDHSAAAQRIGFEAPAEA